ncbi:PHP domain-containing protein [Mammaliicoccus sciuri]|uniref:PHP domain-containing protein n=1 Tax=Mammaliicoccus sciuri TaxID=1296 RepID=UPI0019530593|nr:PHP domain-containing protein [Mammaliicoccus sciuri]
MRYNHHNRVALHNHSTFSNLRIIDAISTPRELLETAGKLGYRGLAITEHESLSSAVKMISELKDLKSNNLIREDFKLILGNEIYLVDSLEEVRDNYQSGGVTKFPHFILMAKNRKGFEALAKLSSQAWKNSFFTGLMERVPTEKEYLRSVVQSEEYRDTIIGTSSCVGSNINIQLQKMMQLENEGKREHHYNKAREEIDWCIETFGKDNFYIELQPAESEVQIFCNKQLVKLAEETGLECVIANDVHYARPEDRDIHRIFLQSKDGDRENIDEFYYYCYMHSVEEMRKQMSYLPEEVIERALRNTELIYDKVEEYDLYHKPIIPKSTIPEFELSHVFKPVYDKYENIKYLAESEHEDNRYLLYLIEEGYFKELHYEGISREKFHEILKRIDSEISEIKGVGEALNQTMSSYYLTCREIVNIMWDDSECGGQSLVGSGRGSGAGFLINYLLGITQINPLEYINMNHTRHLSKERVDGLPDIDVDCEGSKRKQIISALKHHYGEDRVLNVCTYGTEGAKSALKMAARGLNIPDTEAQYLGSFIKTERGSQWSITDTLYGNESKGREANTQFKNEISKYPMLEEVALRLEGLVTRRGIHAGGVIIFNDDAYKTNAIMTASRGETHVTQYNLADSEYMGGVKFDVLSVENLDRIRSTLDLLEKDGLISSDKSLRENFRDLLHPKNLNLEDKEYFKMASTGETNDLFQFQTEIGISVLKKIKPETFEEFCAANSLMRLQSDGGEQPIDKYIRHKNDISQWYKEMEEAGLSKEEVKIMEEHLLHDKGLNITQESSMKLSADPRISNFNVVEQNKLRKAIAKPKGAALGEVKDLFYRKGKEQGASTNLLDYVWNVQFAMQFSYSFSQLHVTAYSIIGIQNLELNRRFPRIYWQTASLNVDSDSNSEDSKDIDYEKIASGIGKMRRNGVHVKLPDINKSDLEFTPDVKNNAIIYGLKPVKSLNDEIVRNIMNNRPYNSLEDVFTKLYDTKLIKNTHIIAMAKSGMLDSFGERKQIMMEVIRYITDLKTTLTMQNVKLLLEANVLEGRPELELIEFRETFKNNVLRKEASGNSKAKHKIFKVVDMETYDKLIGNEGIVNVMGNYYEVNEKEFKKVFDKKISKLKDWLKTEEPIKRANRYALNQQWLKYALGTYSKWEMETLSFYYHEHELAGVNSDLYEIANFSDLPETAEIESYNKYKGREIPKYKLYNICGTVIAKNPTKHMVTLITTDGSVVSVKYHSGSYSHYAKTVKQDGKVIEGSWFDKGNHLLVHGFRRGGQFVAKKYKDSKTSTTTKLIEAVHEDGLLSYKLEREYI